MKNATNALLQKSSAKLLLLGLLVLTSGWILASAQSASAQQSSGLQHSDTSHLSYTKYGWKNVDYWMPHEQNELGIDHVHPLVWSGLILFAALAFACWGASEVEIETIARNFRLRFRSKDADQARETSARTFPDDDE